MKKLERYDISDFGYVPCSDGDVCKSEEVANLEAKCAELENKCAELESKCAELLEALEGLAMKAGRHFWRDVVVTQARAAIAKAKGEQP